LMWSIYNPQNLMETTLEKDEKLGGGDAQEIPP